MKCLFTVVCLFYSAVVLAAAENEIYLDYQATTQCDERVLNSMLPYFNKKFGNPNSKHQHGKEAHDAVEKARAIILKSLHANKNGTLVFTSGATEANNLAIKGVARAYKKLNGKNHIITCVTEHKCVLEACKQLEKEGFAVTYLPVQKSGIINLEDLKNAITDKTILVTIMAANNEIGTLQPIDQIAKICHSKSVLFHTDAAQAVGKIPINISSSEIDLLSMSGHKIYGPKGIGALYIGPEIKIKPLFNGGGQEKGIRSGTVPVALCVGLSEAVNIAINEMQKESKHLLELREMFYKKISTSLTGVSINGDIKQRLPGNLNITFEGVDLEDLLKELNGLAISSGSACTSDAGASYVIAAIDPDQLLPPASMRIGFGRFTTESEITSAADQIIKAVKHLRKIKPDGGKRSCKSKASLTEKELDKLLKKTK